METLAYPSEISSNLIPRKEATGSELANFFSFSILADIFNHDHTEFLMHLNLMHETMSYAIILPNLLVNFYIYHSIGSNEG